MEYNKFCRIFLFARLEQLEGSAIYSGMELADTICEEVANIEITPTTILDWWQPAADYFDYERGTFGEVSNPFANTKRYIIDMVRAGVENLFYRCYSWQEEDILTDEVIERIKQECPNYVKF